MLYIPRVALQGLLDESVAVLKSDHLKEAVWKGVGKEVAEEALQNSQGNLAKWQIERIVRRLEAQRVGEDVLEVQFVKTAVVVLVQGAASRLLEPKWLRTCLHVFWSLRNRFGFAPLAGA